VLSKQAPAQSAFPAATLIAAANGTSLFVNDTTQVAAGQSIAVGGAVTQVTAVNATSLIVATPIAAPAGSVVIAGIQYAISVANSGNSVATNVAVSDVLPPGSIFVAASDGGSFAAGVVTWNLGSIDPGAARTVSVAVIPGGPGALTNVASASCGACVVANASADTSVGGLRVTKRTTTPIASAGGAATYVIDVVNTSAAPVAGVTIDDTLPSGFSYASTTSIVNDGAAISASTSPASGDIVPMWGTFSIAAGKTLTITFVANIAASAGAASYQNAAGATPVASTVTFDPLSTTADDVTVLAANTGVLDGRVYLDNDHSGGFDPLVDTPVAGVGVTIVDATATTYTLTTDADGRYGRVVAAGTASVDVDDAALPPGVVLGAAFSDPASVAVPDGGSVTHDVGYGFAASAPDLAVSKSHGGNFAQGQVGATYTIAVANVGGGPTSGPVTVADTLPAGLTATGLSGTGWTCDLPTLTCTRSDPLAASASYPVITLTVDVAANAAASVTNTATVAVSGDANAANNASSDTATVTVTPPPPPLAPDLTIAKTHAGSFVRGSSGATYAITVSNAGTGTTVGAVTVTDTLPSGLTATSIGGTGWTCSLAALTCTRADALAAGASYPAIVIAVDVAAAAPASIVNIASVSGGGDTNATNNAAADAVTAGGGQAVAPAPIPMSGSAVALLAVLLAVSTLVVRRRSIHRR
jgi:uncharacterized repeat protein (TIGR01451 family)